MRIGVLTAGGDCPGLNAVIRAVVRRASADDVDVLGIKNGWRGLVENDHVELTRASVLGILPRGGTILGTSRLNPLKDEQLMGRLKENLRILRLDGLIVVGGEGSLSVARDLWRDHQVPLELEVIRRLRRFRRLIFLNAYRCNLRNLRMIYLIFIVGSPSRIQVRRTSRSVVANFA